MAGGSGDDTYWVDNPGDSVTEAVGGGSDLIRSLSDYTLADNSGIEFLNAKTATTGLELTGNEFNNTIVGGSGNDTITGAGGGDKLWGHAGADVFALLALDDSSVFAGTRDNIADFSALEGDLIGLSALDSDITLGGDQAFTFIGNAAFSAAGQIRTENLAGRTIVSGNVDSDLGADFAVKLVGSHTLSAAAFIL